MRIAYLTCVYPPYPGGIGVSAQGMAEEMVKRGHEVHIFTSRNSHTREILRSAQNDKFVNIHFLRSWFHFGNAAFLPQLLWRLKNFDIIHLCYPFFGVAELMPFLKKLSRAKIVVHHLMDAVAPGLLGRVFAWHTKYLAPRIFRAVDKVLVLSEDYARNSEVANFGVPWEVVPIGVDTDLFHPPPHPNPSPSGRGQGEGALPTVLFVGGLDRAHYFKGVPVLIKACALLKSREVQFKCQIVGEGSLRKAYEKQAEELGIRNQESGVEFVGLVPHEELPAYYARATVVVVPSTERVECFSIVAAEAQSCGVPVIVSDFPGARVTIEDGVTGYVVKPGNPEELARAIQEFIDNSQKLEKMGNAARKRAVALYDWKIIGDKLEMVYESR